MFSELERVVAEVVVLDLEPGLAQTSVEVGDRAVLDVDLVPTKTPVAAARVAVVVAGVSSASARSASHPAAPRGSTGASAVHHPAVAPRAARRRARAPRIVGAMSMFATGSSTCAGRVAPPPRRGGTEIISGAKRLVVRARLGEGGARRTGSHCPGEDDHGVARLSGLLEHSVHPLDAAVDGPKRRQRAAIVPSRRRPRPGPGAGRRRACRSRPPRVKDGGWGSGSVANSPPSEARAQDPDHLARSSSATRP